jgi:hypothetical protein
MKTATGILLVLAAIIGGVIGIEHAELHSTTLDSQTWVTNESRSIRVRMAGDVIRQLKAGPHERASVRKLLGKPSAGGSRDAEWEYRLGMTTFGLYTLIIRFDDQGRIADAFLRRL